MSLLNFILDEPSDTSTGVESSVLPSLDPIKPPPNPWADADSKDLNTNKNLLSLIRGTNAHAFGQTDRWLSNLRKEGSGL